MSNSVVKVTETPIADSIILVIDEDGTVRPDKQTVKAYLNSRSGETELQIMHVNKSDGKSMDVTVDTLTYLASHNEEGTYSKVQDMAEISRNLNSFRMDHDYTPLTSPRRPSPVEEVTEIDELAHTLSILEGSNTEQLVTRVVSPVKVVKTGIKTTPKRIVPIINTQTNKNKIKPTQSTTIFKQPVKSPVKTKVVKQKPVEDDEQEEEEENYSDEDFTMESEESEDDANDSDFEIDESLRNKTVRKISRARTRIQSEPALDSPRSIKITKTVKTFPPKLNIPAKTEPEPSKVEKPPEISAESKVLDKKTVPKKEKKIPKPIPDDFALFSTPDIIRRVGGKQDSVTTPTTPNTPESPKSLKPARIFPEMPTKSFTQRSSLDTKEKRLSTDVKSVVPEKESLLMKQPGQRLSLGSENKNKERRHSLEMKMRRQSVDVKTDFRINVEKPSDIKKIQASVSDASSSKGENHVTVQSLDEASGGNSNESITENQLEPIPSAEDIRAIIQNEDTKTFTTSLVIPEPEPSAEHNNIDQAHINLETAALDLDQSILDNINSDLISEDILYQVAQSLVDNAELQNAIDKSLVDGNLVLDPSIHSVTHDHGTPIQQSQTTLSDQDPAELSTPVLKGTQIVRSGGRVVVIPPIERPTTRSRNKKQQEVEIPKQIKLPNRLLDDEHVSGAELDSSSDDDKSDDDPDKLWCICNQPHNNRFMICCDTCEEWYHGKCVNVTKAMGQMMEQEGKEWICLYCKDSSLTRPAAAARRVRKASRTSSTENVAIDRKSDVTVTSPLGSPTSAVPGCLVCGKPCRTNSIYCSDPCILKHAKVVEKVVVFERSSGRILSGNNAPSAANLDKWLQQNPGFEVVRSTNANKPVTTSKPLTQSKLKIVKNPPTQGGVSLAIQRKGVNVSILRHSPKPQQQVPGQQKTVKQNITGFKIISKQVVATPRTKLIQPAPLVRNPGVIASSKPKLVQSTITPVKPTTPQPPKEKPMPQKTPKSRQAEETAPQPKKEENIRDNVQKTLLEQLTNRLKLVDDIKLTKEEITKISTDIELQLYKCFGDTGQKYRNKYRSLIFNIKDIKNQTLWRRICEKSISPYQLVRLSPDDMASQELALWRERENKHQLEMITKSELEQLGRKSQYVFKTHKGEQELEENRPTDAVDNTEVIMALGADSSASPESSSDVRKDPKDKEKKGSKHSRSDRDKNHDRKSNKEKDKDGRKDRKRDRRSSSRDRSRRKKSRSKEREANRHTEKIRSRSRDRERHRRSSHKSSRHKKDIHSTTEKLDKKSKEILEQLVDNKIVPPLEDRLWKHVQQEDITTAPIAESDSDHEPTSTVTIPTPPRTGDMEELQSTPVSSNDISEIKDEKLDEEKNVTDVSQVDDSYMDDDGSRSPPPRTQADFIWKGTINMVDVAQISITAHEVSGDCTGLGEELPPCLDVVGRISPDTVWDYIGKMKCSNSKAISLLRLNATNMEEKMPYIALYSYLSSRNRLGVVKSNNKAVKDFYILPLASQKPIPQALLPLSGPGFEESRPALLLGIIVRDKRKRPLFGTSSVSNKRTKLDIPSLPTTPIAQSVTPSRSYTPPPNSDPRLKHSSVLPKVSVKDSPSPKEEPVEDMDEPYSPEDSDPDTAPITPADSSKSSTHLNAADLSNLLTGSVKSSSFLETGLTTQTFEPFSNKFDTIPGLDESGAIIAADSEELKRKMEELDQRIAMQKAEIDNMSQNIASSSSSNIGTSALASIALPSNLQQILDSIKGINATTGSEEETLQMIKQESKPTTTTDSDLTIPLILPKISARSHSVSAAAAASSTSSPTIPLNLPKYKSKLLSTGNSPTQQNIVTLTKTVSQRHGESDKSASVLSSLSEEDLIRKAAEMLGETEDSVKCDPKEFNSPAPSYKATTFSSGPIAYTAPPNLLPLSPLMGTTPISVVTSKSAKLDVSQPPIPGLDD